MNKRGVVWGVVVLCAALQGVVWVLPAQAQTRYHCRDDSGNTFTLSVPCPAGTRTTAAVAGPVTSSSYSSSYSSSSRSSTPYRPPPEMPDHHSYMSGRCRSLDENIRNAYALKIKPEVLDGMRREYRRDCREEEQDAYSRLSSERRAREQERREDAKQAELTAQRSREEEQRHAIQCAESRRILANKRARTDLTDGEKNDLRRFEEAFFAKCTR